METVVGLTAIAVALLIGLGALGTAIGFGLLAANSWKALLVNQKWFRCCRSKCSSLPVCSTP